MLIWVNFFQFSNKKLIGEVWKNKIYNELFRTLSKNSFFMDFDKFKIF